MNWSFAIVNGRLAEVFFGKQKSGEKRIFAHRYVGEHEYKTKKEKAWIKKDTSHNRLAYRNKKYRRLLSFTS